MTLRECWISPTPSSHTHRITRKLIFPVKIINNSSKAERPNAHHITCLHTFAYLVTEQTKDGTVTAVVEVGRIVHISSKCQKKTIAKNT